MRGLVKWGGRLIGLGAVLAAAGLALAYMLVSRSLPDYESRREVDGLTAPIEILRDANAVPHVLGVTDADVYFGLGYAHAQDRLWQMELARRTAQGRLSELFGARALRIDRLMRSLQLYGYAQAAVGAQSEAAQAALEAYAAGVNARIEVVNREALGRGAPEFFAFPATVTPWTPADSIAIVKLMALRLSNAAASETRRAGFLLRLAPDQVADLLPDYPDPGITALPPYASLYPGARFPYAAVAPDPLTEALGPAARPELAGASNVWAVAAERSASGASLLASDPHLWLSAPSLWMLARLEFPGGGVIGGTIAGVPAVLVGRNRAIAWGMATANVDDQDVFIEQLNPADPEQYLAPDGWRRFESREVSIGVRGADPVAMTVRASRHGPVVPLDQFGLAAVTPEGNVPALAWTALTADDTSLEAALTLMRATTIEEAEAAAALHVAPAQNIVVADRSQVALIVAGRAPRRNLKSRTRGRTPSPGWTAENDWTGYLDAAAMPRAIRPASGVVANANNRTTDAEYPENLSYDWGAPYRIRRIEKQLGGRRFHTAASFKALQTDAVSEMARSVLPLIATDLWWGPEPADQGARAALRREALDRLADWNGEMSENLAEPLIFSAWMRALTRRLTADELGPLEREFEGSRPLFVERVFRDVDGAGRWCDVDKTAQRETCPEIAALALDDALDELTRDYGPAIDAWRWGEAHVAIQVHNPLGYVRALGWLFNIRNETSGGDYTVLRGAMRGAGPTPYANIHAGGFRAVYDFTDLDRSAYIQSTGQSGHFLSRWYDNLAALWADGGYIPMSLNIDDARAGSVGSTYLRPR